MAVVNAQVDLALVDGRHTRLAKLPVLLYVLLRRVLLDAGSPSNA